MIAKLCIKNLLFSRFLVFRNKSFLADYIEFWLTCKIIEKYNGFYKENLLFSINKLFHYYIMYILLEKSNKFMYICLTQFLRYDWITFALYNPVFILFLSLYLTLFIDLELAFRELYLSHIFPMLISSNYRRVREENTFELSSITLFYKSTQNIIKIRIFSHSIPQIAVWSGLRLCKKIKIKTR